MKFTVEGAEHELSRSLEPEFCDAFKSACDGMSKALEIIRSPGFAERSGWKVDCSNDYVTVHYKDIDGLRYFAAKTIVAVKADVLVDLHWKGLAKAKEYNDNMKFSEHVQQLTDDIDIAHYASNEKFMVKSREFVVARMKKKIGDGFVLAGRSCNVNSLPPSKDAVRGLVHVAAGWYKPNPEDPEHSSIYEYLVSMDLKGMLVKTVANQALGKMVRDDMENNRIYALKLAAR
uniref:START domain-containing protein n=1 Tax=Haemonchus contortus TaxID=6289 RepID=A0A7I4XTX5_HAECO|nr:Lipid-binding START domain containing protein [Haemonchus contortus]